MTRKQDPLTVEFLLLGLIDREPIHAYDLHKRLSNDTDLSMLWYFNQSRLYAILDKIEKNGLVESVPGPGEAYPLRKVYHLTESGKICFEEWLHIPVRHVNQMRSDFLAKLYFLQERPKAEYLQMIDEQTAAAQNWITEISAAAAAAEDPFSEKICSFRLSLAEAALRWLRQIREN